MGGEINEPSWVQGPNAACTEDRVTSGSPWVCRQGPLHAIFHGGTGGEKGDTGTHLRCVCCDGELFHTCQVHH